MCLLDTVMFVLKSMVLLYQLQAIKGGIMALAMDVVRYKRSRVLRMLIDTFDRLQHNEIMCQTIKSKDYEAFSHLWQKYKEKIKEASDYGSISQKYNQFWKMYISWYIILKYHIGIFNWGTGIS